MIIEADKRLLLFRFSNYRRTDFLKEHSEIIDKFGYTWMLKAGKRSSNQKISGVMADGGILILRSPTGDGGKFYAAACSEFTEQSPDDGEPFPAYYTDYIRDLYDIPSFQWFKVKKLYAIADDQLDKIVLHLTREKIVDVLKTTRTAVMFVDSTDTIELTELRY